MSVFKKLAMIADNDYAQQQLLILLDDLIEEQKLDDLIEEQELEDETNRFLEGKKESLETSDRNQVQVT
jgi:hypothetical protein